MAIKIGDSVISNVQHIDLDTQAEIPSDSKGVVTGEKSANRVVVKFSILDTGVFSVAPTEVTIERTKLRVLPVSHQFARA